MNNEEAPEKPKRLNPYVGPRAFQEDEREFFFGRDEETAILEGLVMARRIALFFAQSGAGKSSLLRAGLIPELTRKQTLGSGQRARTYHKMRVLPILGVGQALSAELDGSVANIYIHSALLGLYPGRAAGDLAGMTLAGALAPLFSNGAPAEEAPATYGATLLIFDQFEELFTHHPNRWADREDFFRQVANAVERYPSLHVLFTMREDHIAELVPYAGLLPEELRPRFRMERLKPQAALDAVQKPVKLPQRFDPLAAETLVANLRRVQARRPLASAPPLSTASGEPAPASVPPADGAPGRAKRQDFGEYVEPVHLQIVCHQLWERMETQRPGWTVIGVEDLEDFGDVDQALIGFYESAVAKAVADSGVSERMLRDWFDDSLITPARTRGLVYRDITETAGLPNTAVDVLDRSYIIRPSVRGEDTWYELAHDRLVEPILQANRTWQKTYYNPLVAPTRAWQNDPTKLVDGRLLAEAEAFSKEHAAELLPDEKKLLEESRRMDDIRQTQERQKTKRRQVYAITSILVIAALVALTGWALRNAAEAKEASALAERHARIATARELAAAAILNVDTDPERSVLLALQAVSTTYGVDSTVTVEAENALHRALEAQRLQRTIDVGDGSVSSAVFGPNDDWISTSGADGKVRIWDVSSGKLLRTMGDGSRPILGHTLSPDGKRLVTAGEDGIARIWDTDTGQLLSTLSDHTGPVWGLNFSPDGTKLVTTSDDKTVKVRDSQSGAVLLTLVPGFSERVTCASFSPDGRRLVTSNEKTPVIGVWDAILGTLILTMTGHTDGVPVVAFSPDGTLLASASRDGTGKIWDAATGEQKTMLSGHSQGYGRQVLTIAFSPDGRWLATGSDDKTVKIWDTATGGELLTLLGHTGPVWSVNFTQDGKRLASAGGDGTVKIWDLTPSHEGPTIERPQPVRAVAFSPDGKRLASGRSDGVAEVWDAVTGKGPLVLEEGHTDEIKALAFDPTGKWVASASMDGTAKLWDATSGELLHTVSGHNKLLGVAFSPDDRRLATAGVDGIARVWDVSPDGSVGPDPVLSLRGHQYELQDVAFSPDGKLLATAGNDKTAKVWDATSGGEPLLTLSGHEGFVIHVAFSPDGKRLATASDDGTARVWDVSTGQLTLVLMGHTDGVHGVTFSPNGKRLATASLDGTVGVWDATTGQELFSLPGHAGQVRRVAFSPDGTRLAAASEDGIVRLYVMDARELARLAQDRVRSLLELGR